MAAAIAPHCAMHARIYVGIVKLSCEDGGAAVRAAAIQAILGTHAAAAAANAAAASALRTFRLIQDLRACAQRWRSTCPDPQSAVVSRAATSSRFCSRFWQRPLFDAARHLTPGPCQACTRVLRDPAVTVVSKATAAITRLLEIMDPVDCAAAIESDVGRCCACAVTRRAGTAPHGEQPRRRSYPSYMMPS